MGKLVAVVCIPYKILAQHSCAVYNVIRNQHICDHRPGQKYNIASFVKILCVLTNKVSSFDRSFAPIDNFYRLHSSIHRSHYLAWSRISCHLNHTACISWVCCLQASALVDPCMLQYLVSVYKFHCCMGFLCVTIVRDV